MTNDEWLNEPMKSAALIQLELLTMELLGVGTGTNTVLVSCGYCGWQAKFPSKLYAVANEEYNNHECSGDLNE